MKYVSIKSVLSDWLDMSGHEGERPSEPVVYKWANDVVRGTYVPQNYVQVIKKLCIENYQVGLPEDFDCLIQAAYRLKPDKKRNKRINIREFVMDTYGEGCELVISMNCPKCHESKCTCDQPEVIIDADELWRKAHPEYHYAHLDWMRSYGGFDHENRAMSSYHPEYRLLRPVSDTYFNSEHILKQSIHWSKELMNNCRHEFKIDGNVMHVNFEKGDVIISYRAHKKDAEGYLMIPDDPDLLEAITQHLEYRISYIEWKKKGEARYERAWRYAKAEYMRHKAIAKERLNTPNYNTWADFLDREYDVSCRAPKALTNSELHDRNAHYQTKTRLSNM